MSKNVFVSACLVLSLSSVSHARIIQCIDESGHRYFTDTSCPRQQLTSPRLESSRPGSGISGLTINKPANTKSLEFYCNPRKGKFIRCE